MSKTLDLSPENAPFIQIDDAHVVIHSKGIYAPTSVCRNQRNEVFFKWSRGFIRPRANGDTSMDKVFWKDLVLPKGMYLVFDGYQAKVTNKKPAKKRVPEPAE